MNSESLGEVVRRQSVGATPKVAGGQDPTNIGGRSGFLPPAPTIKGWGEALHIFCWEEAASTPKIGDVLALAKMVAKDVSSNASGQEIGLPGRISGPGFDRILLGKSSTLTCHSVRYSTVNLFPSRLR